MAPQRKPFFSRTGRFEIIAHRGSSREFPENTLASFRRALEICPQAILELDVWPSRDGHVMVMHDGLLEKSTSGAGPVFSKTLAELREFEAGYSISFDSGVTYPYRGRGHRLATLPEVFSEFPDARMSVDIKYNAPAFAAQVVKLVEEFHAEDRVILGSFHNRIVKLVRSLNSRVATSFSKAEVLRFIIMHKLCLSRLFRGGGDAMMIPEYTSDRYPEEADEVLLQGMHVVSPRFIKDAHKKGIPVFIWTVNRSENMRRLINWGVDGIVSDLPGELCKIVVGRE